MKTFQMALTVFFLVAGVVNAWLDEYDQAAYCIAFACYFRVAALGEVRP